MGRGDRPTSSGEALRSQVVEPSRYEVVLAVEAEDELTELVTYIQQDSPRNAIAVYEAISKRLYQLGANPKIGHADPNAPLVPEGASALLTTTKTIGIHYLFPLDRGDREIVFVVGIRRGSRMPLERPEYTLRWLEELAKVAPSPLEPDRPEP